MEAFREALRRFGRTALIGAAIGFCIGNLYRFLPEWLYMGIWGAIILGSLVWVVLIARDTRRMERESANIDRKRLELMAEWNCMLGDMAKTQTDFVKATIENTSLRRELSKLDQPPTIH